MDALAPSIVTSIDVAAVLLVIGIHLVLISFFFLYRSGKKWRHHIPHGEPWRDPPAAGLRNARRVHRPLAGREAYPRRGAQLGSPTVWIEDKVAVDCARYPKLEPHLHRIHGRVYDLAVWAEKHPGGRTWLDLTAGTDCTVAFECHHLNAALAESVLAKFEVKKSEPRAEERERREPPPKGLSMRSVAEGERAEGDSGAEGDDAAARTEPQFAETSEGPIYVWDDKGFYRTLKRRVLRKLGPTAASRAPTSDFLWLCRTVLAAWGACFWAMCACDGWHAWAAAVGAGFLLHALMGIGHNFFHQADSYRRHGLWRHCFDLTLFSSHAWRITHAISHHLCPNLENDIEVSAMEPLLYFMTSSPINNPFVFLVFNATCVLASTMDYVRHALFVVIGREGLRWENFIAAAELAALVRCHGGGGPGGGGARTAAALFFTMQGIASWMLLSVSFAVHRSERSWTAGDPKPQRDFGQHIVAVTADHSVRLSAPLSLLFFALLNNHTIHHLFPTVDHSRLKSIYPIFLETCREFAAKDTNFCGYQSFGFLELWRSMIRRHDLVA